MSKSNVIIVGVDLMPMSSPSGLRQPKYSVAILSNGKIVSRMSDVTRRRLINLIWKVKPNILATDNIYELAPTSRKILKLLSLLPAKVKLVQVTGSPETGFTALEQLAYQHGLIRCAQKLSSSQSAEVIAKLAAMGVGFLVTPSRGEVRVVVSRCRRPGEGGMSEHRFKRKIRASILEIAKEIRELLDRNGFDYDVFIRKGKCGFDGCLFTVYAPLGKVRQIIREAEYGDAQVKIFLKSSSKLMFTPLSAENVIEVPVKEYLIVGVDPGIVTGVAILNVYGELLGLLSKRHLSRGELISLLMDYGQPVLIATDVRPPPSFAEKLASMLKAHLFIPLRSLSSEEKLDIVRDFLSRKEAQRAATITLDSHKRDALAAALKAYMHYKNKFEQAEAHVKQLGVHVSLKKLRALIIQGYSIKRAIELLTQKKEVGAFEKRAEAREHEAVKKDVKSELVRELREKLKLEKERVQMLTTQRDQLMSKVRELELKIKRLEEMINQLQSDVFMKLKKDRELVALEHRVSTLSSLVEKLKHERDELENKIRSWRNLLLRLVKGELIVLKPVRTLTKDNVVKGISAFNIKRDDFVYVRDLSVIDLDAVNMLSKIGVKCIVGKRAPPHVASALEEHGIPFISEDELSVVWLDDLPLANRDELNNLAEELRSRLMSQVRLRELSKLKELFDKYREERIKEFRKSRFSHEALSQ